RFGLELGLPLHLRGHPAGFRLRAQLGDQVLLTLLRHGWGSLLFLLYFLANAGFLLTQSGLGLGVAAANGFLGLGLELGPDGVQLRLPLLVTLARFGYGQFFLLLRLETQT